MSVSTAGSDEQGDHDGDHDEAGVTQSGDHPGEECPIVRGSANQAGTSNSVLFACAGTDGGFAHAAGHTRSSMRRRWVAPLPTRWPPSGRRTWQTMAAAWPE